MIRTDVTDVKIIMALVEKHGDPVSINRLAEELDIDYKNVYNVIKRFEKENLVSLVQWVRLTIVF